MEGLEKVISYRGPVIVPFREDPEKVFSHGRPTEGLREVISS